MSSNILAIEVKKESEILESNEIIPSESTDGCMVQRGVISNESTHLYESTHLNEPTLLSEPTHLNESANAPIVKKEFFSNELTDALSAQREIISNESINLNDLTHLNEPTNLNESTNVPMIKGEIFRRESTDEHMVKNAIIRCESTNVLTVKKEYDCKTEITYELVDCMGNSGLTSEEGMLAMPVKTEDYGMKTQNENQGDENFSVLNRSSSCNNPKSFSTSSKANRDIVACNSIVSVELVDIFSENERRQGNAHSSVGLCQCVFCHPEYNRKAISLLVSKNLESQKRLMSTQFQRKASFPPKSPIEERSWGKNGKMAKYIQTCKCLECGLICISSGILKVHMRKHTGERPFECRRCSASFKRRSHLDCHIRMKHSDARPFKCDKCPLAFKDHCDLTKHLKLHSNARPFSCKICGAAFKRNYHLKMHRTRHMEFSERPFKCSLCPLTFTRNNLLNHHLRSHYDKNPFKCKECPSAFKTNYLLKKHLFVHIGKKPFECDLCGMSFIRNAALKNHVTHKHDVIKRFTCDICSKTFKVKPVLIQHIHRLHSDLKIANYECDVCKKKFHLKPQIRSHLKFCHISYSDRQFKCKYCCLKFKKRSALKKHQLIHTEGNLVTCGFCSIAFGSKRSLSHHVNTQH